MAQPWLLLLLAAVALRPASALGRATKAALDAGVKEAYSPAAAKAFAALSKLTYCGHNLGTAVSVKRTCGGHCHAAGFEVSASPVLVSEAAAFAVVAPIKPTGDSSAITGSGCVIAFGGTKDWTHPLQDINTTLVPWQSEHCPKGAECKVMASFDATWTALKPGILEGMQEAGCSTDTKLYVTGHGLGAAVATVAMFSLKDQFVYDLQTSYTFAGPKIGNLAFVKAFNGLLGSKIPLFAVTHLNDEVPRFPPGDNYTHAGFQAWYSNHSEHDYTLCASYEEENCGVFNIPRGMLCPINPAVQCTTQDCDNPKCGAAPAGGPHCQSPLAPEDNFCRFGDLEFNEVCMAGAALPEHPEHVSESTPAPKDEYPPKLSDAEATAAAMKQKARDKASSKESTTATPTTPKPTPAPESTTATPTTPKPTPAPESTTATPTTPKPTPAPVSAKATPTTLKPMPAPVTLPSPPAVNFTPPAVGALLLNRSAAKSENPSLAERFAAEGLAFQEPCFAVNVSFAPEDMYEELPSKQPNAEMCQKQCKETPWCRVFSYFPLGKACHLGGKWSTLDRISPGAVGGVESCELDKLYGEALTLEKVPKIIKESLAQLTEARDETTETISETVQNMVKLSLTNPPPYKPPSAESLKPTPAPPVAVHALLMNRSAAKSKNASLAERFEAENLIFMEPCFAVNVSFTPLDVYEELPTRQPDAAACQAMCKTTDYCKVFSYFPLGKACHMSGKWATLAPISPGAIGGTKSCDLDDLYGHQYAVEEIPKLIHEATDQITETRTKMEKMWNLTTVVLPPPPPAVNLTVAPPMASPPAAAATPAEEASSKAKPLDKRTLAQVKDAFKAVGLKLVTPCFAADTAFAPMDMYGSLAKTLPSASACQAECANTTDCSVFTYLMSSQTCHLSGKFALREDTLGAIGGPASCDQLYGDDWSPSTAAEAVEESVKEIQHAQARMDKEAAELLKAIPTPPAPPAVNLTPPVKPAEQPTFDTSDLPEEQQKSEPNAKFLSGRPIATSAVHGAAMTLGVGFAVLVVASLAAPALRRARSASYRALRTRNLQMHEGAEDSRPMLANAADATAAGNEVPGRNEWSEWAPL